MKSLLKSLPPPWTTDLKPIGICENDLDALFGEEFAKSNHNDFPKHSADRDDSHSSLNDEWLDDPYGSSSSSGDEAGSVSSSRRRRVHWNIDENDTSVRVTSYASPYIKQNVSPLWFNVEDFRRFRSSMHSISMAAGLDKDYADIFQALYESCQTPSTTQLPPIDLEEQDFGTYRGLERAIFRTRLQLDKVKAIRGTLWAQSNVNGNFLRCEDERNAEIAETAQRLTAPAARLARMLAVYDAAAIAAQQRSSSILSTTQKKGPQHAPRRRMIEI